MSRSARVAIVAFVALLVATACSQTGTNTPSGSASTSSAAGSTINVMSLWGASEQDNFQKVLDAFKTKTGVTAKYESVRTDYATTLQTRISGGNPPDVAIIPGIGFLRQFARQGSLKKISDLGIDTNALKANYPPGILGIGQVFSANPQAAIYYEGGFVGGIATGQTNTALKVGDTIDWFDFPAINNNKSVTIGGDVIAAFTTKPGVKEFIQYMTTSDAGSVWAGTGAIISPVKSVPASAYPNDLAKREAAQVANASAVRFDGSDLLPSGGGDDMGAALQDALRGKTVDWAKFETSIQAKWKAEK